MGISKTITRYTMVALFSIAFYFGIMIHIFPKMANETGLIFWIGLIILDIAFALQ